MWIIIYASLFLPVALLPARPEIEILCLNEAITVAQNCPLSRLMSAFGAVLHTPGVACRTTRRRRRLFCEKVENCFFPLCIC